MATIDVLVPQMGEGLTEVRILEFKKQPGETIHRDEIIYSMETDKATLDVESPYEGVLQEWLAEEGAILPIGAPVARVDAVSSEAAEPETTSAAAGTEGAIGHPSTQEGEVRIPPRTRAYCRQLGISEEEMRSIPAPGGKLMPGDVDSYLAAKAAGGATETVVAPAAPAYTEQPLSPQQRLFIYRIKRSAQVVIPGTIKRPVSWKGIRQRVEEIRAKDPTLRPTDFQTFAYCVSQAVKDHAKFRSALIGEETVREYTHLNLGIAVARPNGELVTAVVADADALRYPDFIRSAQERILAAREGEDQADATTQILLTYLGAHGVIDAIPVLVSPAVAVIFIGATYPQDGDTLANLVLTIDHRLINGVEAALFLNAVVEKVGKIAEADLT